MKVFLIAFFFSLSYHGYSQSISQHLQSNTIKVSFPFLLFSPDARSSSLGDAGVAVSSGQNSFHWNTANIGFSEELGGISVSYSPWLYSLVTDIHLIYVSSFTKLGSDDRHSLGGSIRYLSDANQPLFNGSSLVSGDFVSNDLELLGGYSFKISEHSSVGLNGKFIYSDALQNVSPDSLIVKAAMVGAVDLSYAYMSRKFSVGKMKGCWSWGAAISNIGNKSFYSTIENKDYLPANLRIGSAFGLDVGADHKIIVSMDLNKLMVPSSSANVNNISAIQGVFRSFNDSQDGLMGEIKELTIGGGVEYVYRDLLSLRSGYFYEHPSKGNRRFVSLGAGIKFKSFGLDASYLASLTQNNPLSNTMRFTLSYMFN
ncbi:MAG: hypothetical protein BM555_06015 [Crocinitomix sp. MedPE-SWsnd]|nr:MAG: hypothetical protein BM555_06015 [Crocinitomix sp. MedPE-SWsnd]